MRITIANQIPREDRICSLALGTIFNVKVCLLDSDIAPSIALKREIYSRTFSRATSRTVYIYIHGACP